MVLTVGARAQVALDAPPLQASLEVVALGAVAAEPRARLRDARDTFRGVLFAQEGLPRGLLVAPCACGGHAVSAASLIAPLRLLLLLLLPSLPSLPSLLEAARLAWTLSATVVRIESDTATVLRARLKVAAADKGYARVSAAHVLVPLDARGQVGPVARRAEHLFAEDARLALGKAAWAEVGPQVAEADASGQTRRVIAAAGLTEASLHDGRSKQPSTGPAVFETVPTASTVAPLAPVRRGTGFFSVFGQLGFNDMRVAFKCGCLQRFADFNQVPIYGAPFSEQSDTLRPVDTPSGAPVPWDCADERPNAHRPVFERERDRLLRARRRNQRLVASTCFPLGLLSGRHASHPVNGSPIDEGELTRQLLLKKSVHEEQERRDGLRLPQR